MCCTFVFSSFSSVLHVFFFFFFNDTATTEIYTLSLHDALPISQACGVCGGAVREINEDPLGKSAVSRQLLRPFWTGDRKSTRLNSSHANISYAVFCLKKKKKKQQMK